MLLYSMNYTKERQVNKRKVPNTAIERKFEAGQETFSYPNYPNEMYRALRTNSHSRGRFY